MSSKVTINQSKGVRVVGLLAIIAGIVLILSGGVAFWQVSAQLHAENITVSEDARFFAGKRVADPFTAYAQAEVINRHALEMADGKTYAELAQDDPARATVMNASFLRASLFTSVVAFGLAAVVFGLGVFLILLGWALRRIAGGPAIVVETFDGPGPAPRHGGPSRDGDVVPVTGAVPVVGARARDAGASGAAAAPEATTPEGAAAVVPAVVPVAPASGAQVSEALRRHSLAERRAAAEQQAETRSAAAGAWASARTGATPVVPENPAVPVNTAASENSVLAGSSVAPEAAGAPETTAAPEASGVVPVPVPPSVLAESVGAEPVATTSEPAAAGNPWSRVDSADSQDAGEVAPPGSGRDGSDPDSAAPDGGAEYNAVSDADADADGQDPTPTDENGTPRLI